NSAKTIERRTPAAPTTPIVLAGFNGFLPAYNGITVSPHDVHWLEQEGAAGRMGVAQAFDADPASRKYLSLGNLAVGEIAHLGDFVFYGAGPDLYRSHYICT